MIIKEKGAVLITTLLNDLQYTENVTDHVAFYKHLYELQDENFLTFNGDLNSYVYLKDMIVH